MSGYHLEQAHQYRVELDQFDPQALAIVFERATGSHLPEAEQSTVATSKPQSTSFAAPSHSTTQKNRHSPGGSISQTCCRRLANQPWERQPRPRPLLLRPRPAMSPALFAQGCTPSGSAPCSIQKGATARMLALIKEAQPVFEKAKYELGLIDVSGAIAGIEEGRGHSASALAAYEQARDQAHRAGSRRQEAQMLGGALGALLVGPTPVGQALSWLDTHAAEIEPRGVFVIATRAVLLAMLGRFDDARALVAAAIERQASYGAEVGGLTFYSWYVESLAEDHLAAEREAQRAYEKLENEGSIALSSTVACQWAQSLYKLTRYDEAKAALAIGEEHSATDDTANQIWCPSCARSCSRVRATTTRPSGSHGTPSQSPKAQIGSTSKAMRSPTSHMS